MEHNNMGLRKSLYSEASAAQNAGPAYPHVLYSGDESRPVQESGQVPTLRDVLSWDVVNWSICLKLWDPHLTATSCQALEIGCGPGGLSLWLASKGHRVVCSDKVDPGRAVSTLHKRYGVSSRIVYEAIDATAIPYQDKVDIVILKSVLGGIWARYGTDGLQRTIRGLHNALRPGGKLLFAENLHATWLHMFCRRRFAHRTEHIWRYPTIEELLDFLAPFSAIDYKVGGFTGAFGWTESQRSALGYFDRLILSAVPEHWRYIIAGIATK